MLSVCLFILHFLLLNYTASASLILDDIDVDAPDGWACDSPIYCRGRLLHVVQMAHILKDSKTFVDMHLTASPNVVIERFDQLLATYQDKVPKEIIRKFVSENFQGPGDELESWIPKDWKETPEFIHGIKDDNFRNWAIEINKLWFLLGKVMKTSVRDTPDRFSLLYVPNPFIVPGDRFKEFYYWDTYWIIKGLLVSSMTDTARGMIENLLYMVQTVGHVPNGGRIYYLDRTQPPLLTPMVSDYYEQTRDEAFVARHIGTLEKEYKFWLTNRTTDIQTADGRMVHLARYSVAAWQPRPEGYRQDVELLRSVRPEDRARVQADVISACESGWDFGTRWFRGGQSLTTIATSDIIPVDLNSFLYWNEIILAKFHALLGNSDKQAEYLTRAARRAGDMHKLLWSEQDGCWYDYDMGTGSQRTNFHPTNVFPLFVGALATDQDKVDVVSKIVAYLQRHDIVKYDGGIPSSLVDSGQQWDFPNAWPPLVHFVIQTLRGHGHAGADKMAAHLAHIWLNSNYLSWKKTGHMFEKYDARVAGGAGGGGEYSVQLGFGWTNGAVLDLLHQYGADIQSRDDSDGDASATVSFFDYVALFVLLFTMFVR